MYYTYILGAGASFGTIPLVNQMEGGLLRFADELNNVNKEDFTEFENADINKLRNDIFKICDGIRKFETIDTYAQYVYENRVSREHLSLLEIKVVISFYFSFIQHERKIHNRLNYFLTKIRKNMEISTHKTISKIKFLSWNYDFQVELALNDLFYNESDFNNLLNHIGVLPNHENQNLNLENITLIHLNGIAGLFDIKNNYKGINSLLNRTRSKEFKDILKNLLFFFDSLSKRSIDINRVFAFNWEVNEYRKKLLKKATDIIKNSSKVIVIGYSFPDDNRNFDLNWINSINENCKIIIQDPNPNETLVKELRNKNINVSTSNSTERYFIPNELII